MSNPKTILLVDDDRDLVDSMKKLLETTQRYNIVTAYDGSDAILEYQKLKPDLTILDAKMPRMNGFDAFFEIIKIDEAAKIMMMTGFEEDNRVEEVKKRGFKSGK